MASLADARLDPSRELNASLENHHVIMREETRPSPVPTRPQVVLLRSRVAKKPGSLCTSTEVNSKQNAQACSYCRGSKKITLHFVMDLKWIQAYGRFMYKGLVNCPACIADPFTILLRHSKPLAYTPVFAISCRSILS